MNGSSGETDTRTRWYLPLTRRETVRAVARGWIGPAADNEEIGASGDSGSPRYLVRGGVGKQFRDRMADADKGRPPILLEISDLLSRDVDMDGIDAEGMSVKARLSEPTLVLVPVRGVIPVDAVSALCFASEAEMKDFLVRSYGDVPFEVFKTCVDEDLFARESRLPGTGADVLRPGEADRAPAEALALADRMIGAGLMLLRTLPSDSAWLEGAGRLVAGGGGIFLSTADVVEAVRDAVPAVDRGGEPGTRLLAGAARTLLGMDPAKGWRAETVLDEIVEAAGGGKDLEPFAIKVRAVLANRSTLPGLADDRSIVMRALSLLLVRPEPLDVVGSRNSSLRPGSKVRALAATLSGLHQGLSRLPNSIKSGEMDYRLATRLLVEASRAGTMAEPVDPIVIRSERGIGLEMRHTIAAGDRVLYSCTCGGSKSLSYVREMARRLNFETDYREAPPALKVEFPFPDKRKQVVFVSEGMPDQRGNATVRIHSPCLDLAKRKNRALLKKNDLEQLLVRNAQPGLRCRFAINEAEQVLTVIVDHLVSPLDDAELESHLEHVAKTADDFEKDYGLDEF